MESVAISVGGYINTVFLHSSSWYLLHNCVLRKPKNVDVYNMAALSSPKLIPSWAIFLPFLLRPSLGTFSPIERLNYQKGGGGSRWPRRLLQNGRSHGQCVCLSLLHLSTSSPYLGIQNADNPIAWLRRLLQKAPRLLTMSLPFFLFFDETSKT